MSVLSELNKELYDKVIKLKKKYAYENIPFTIAHTIDRRQGPPKNPYSLIPKKNKSWPPRDYTSKCFYDINGQFFCINKVAKITNKKINPNKILKK